MRYRDDLCPDCRAMTAGDCGQHWTKGDDWDTPATIPMSDALEREYARGKADGIAEERAKVAKIEAHVRALREYPNEAGHLRWFQEGRIDAFTEVLDVLVAALTEADDEEDGFRKCEGCERSIPDEERAFTTSDDVRLCHACWDELVRAESARQEAAPMKCTRPILTDFSQAGDFCSECRCYHPFASPGRPRRERRR